MPPRQAEPPGQPRQPRIRQPAEPPQGGESTHRYEVGREGGCRDGAHARSIRPAEHCNKPHTQRVRGGGFSWYWCFGVTNEGNSAQYSNRDRHFRPPFRPKGRQTPPVRRGGPANGETGGSMGMAGGKKRPAQQPVETGGPGRRRVGVGGEELPRGRREGAAGAATSRGGGDRRGNQSKPVAPGGGGSASAERNSREADGKERPAQQPAEAAATGVATSRNRWPREAAGRRRRGGAPERPTGRSGRRSNRQRRAVPEGGGSAAGQRAPAKKTPRSGTPGCRRTSRLQHNTYDT